MKRVFRFRKFKINFQSLNTRIAMISVTLGIIFTLLSGVLANQYVNETREQRLLNLKQLVELARNSIEPILIKYRSNEMSKDAALEEIRNFIRRMVYKDHVGDNYIFMSSYSGTMLVQPFDTSREMKNMWDLKDSNGVFIIKELIKMAQSEAQRGYVTYHYKTPRSPTAEEKISYVVGIPELECYIGTGKYMSDIRNNQKAYIFNTVFLFFVMLILLTLLVMFSLKEIRIQILKLRKENRERKKAEKALLESQNRLATHIELTPLAVIEFNNNFEITSWNPAAEKTFLYTKEEAIGKNSFEILVPEYEHFSVKKVHETTNKGFTENLNENKTKDGRIITCQWFNTPIIDRNNKLVGMTAVSLDITEKLNTERENILLKDRLDNIFNSMPSILICVDKNGVVTDWNDNAADIMKIPAKEAIGKEFVKISPKYKEFSGKIHSAMQNLRLEFAEKNIRSEGKSTYYEDITIYPLIAKESEGAVIRIDDVSEKIKLQKEIQSLNEQLEHKIDERTKELKKSVNSLKQTQDQLIRSERLAALGNMVVGVAHEINTPVGIGVTEASFLNEITEEITGLFESDTLTESKFQKYLKTVAESSKSILNNLLRSGNLIKHFKQVAVDHTNIERRSFLVKEYLESVIISLKPELKKTNHNITVMCDPELSIVSYPGAFAQIATNLIMNTLLHGFENIDSGEIKFIIKSEKNNLVFHYTDNGIGMDENTLKQVFDPFFTTKRNRGGTGLGMQIVYNLVKQKLSGEIACTSSIGEGVLFEIKMPLK